MQVTLKGILLATLLATLASCHLFNKNKTKTTMATTGDYTSEWKIVDSLDQQQLPKSALEKVESIALRARAENNTEQILKTVIYKGKYTVELEEDGIVKAIQLFETEEKTATQPAKAVLQSMLGEMYHNYLQSNGWNLSQRTPIPDGEGGDILTWSAAQIEKRALDLYLSSVEPIELLYNTPVGNFKELISKGTNDSISGNSLHPTLLDILAYRAIAHTSNESSYLNEPSFRFNLDQEAAFAQPDAFVKTKFESQDLNSGKWRTIQMYQKLTEWHLKKPQSPSIVEVTLRRLDFAKENSSRNDVDKLYISTLDDLLKSWKASPVCTEIMYNQANYWVNQSQIKDAVAICRSAIALFPDSYGANNCKRLLAQLEYSTLQLQIEQHNLPEQAILLHLSYKNTDKGRYKIVEWPEDTDNQNYENVQSKLLMAKAVSNTAFTIKNPGDYQQHQTEIMVNPLPAGNYAIVLSKTGNFDKKEDICDYAFFDCTNIAAIRLASQNDYTDYWVVDRATGQPLAGINGELMEYRWDNNRYKSTLIRAVVSDANGNVRVEGERKNANMYVIFRSGKNTVRTDNFNHYPQPKPTQSREIQFFTDRGMYRPGQTIYFKGIALQRNEKYTPSIIANASVTVTLRDANGQERGKIDLKTNEFGTFNGTFVLPTGVLTGSFSIEAIGDAGRGTTYVQVEEYKRPKFEVTFEPMEGSYRINEQVTVKGLAMNYAGNPSDGSKVTWRVIRRTWTPWWWYKCGGGYYNDEVQEIAEGTTISGIDGKFDIVFKAIPSDQPEAQYPPAFNYEVTAEVTDQSGETRSGETSVKIGKYSVILSNSLESQTILDSLKSVSLITNNLADKKIPTKGSISIQKLSAPNRFFKTKPFQAIDITTIDEATFRKNFPAFAYNEEDLPKNWKPVGAALTYNFDTGKSDKIDLTTQNIAPGHYKVTMEAKDSYGATVTSEKTVEVRKNALDFRGVQHTAKSEIRHPGEKATMMIGTSFPGLFSLVVNNRAFQPVETVWHNIIGNKTIEFPIREADRGGMNTHWIAVYDNRVYTGSSTWQIPFDNKKLDIKFETFRDKMLPGGKEEWRLRITGPNKEKVAAELAASMYDASLDQFSPFQWAFSPFYAYRSSEHPYAQGIGGVQGMNYIPSDANDGIQDPIRNYPELNWYDFPLYGNRGRFRRSFGDYGGAPEVMSASAPAMSMQKEAAGDNYKRSSPVAYLEVEDSALLNKVEKSGTTPTPYPAQIRTNLNETVFFFPELRTDANGDVLVKFTMNEALTRWKFQVFAHTKELQYALAEKSVVTQKDLMITANAPRFFRAGDELEFAAKISNLTDAATTGTASLALMDAATLKPLEKELGLTAPGVTFSVGAKQSTAVRWKISIPTDFTGAVTWRVFADSKTGRDGEESTVPVVTNRMLVTESLPMALRGNQNKTFRFDEWKPSATRTPMSYTLEFTSNPAWYAVQSLPYLMEFPHECSEQVFSRFYANTLAGSITEKMPAIRRIYDRWKGTKALESNLSKNQELKYALLEETPWVLDAQDEAKQKQQIGLLFDLNKMADERTRAINTLSERQSENGGWPWFPGGQESWGITQHIVCGMAHLERLQAFNLQNDATAANMMDRAMGFCQVQADKNYEEIKQRVERGQAKWDDDHLSSLVIQYLYARSFSKVDKPDKIFAFYTNLIGKHWTSKSLYEQGLLALVTYRIGDKTLAASIVKSLKERAMVKEELGMYWPNDWGMYWYQLPVETQAIMIEVFHEVAADRTAVDDLRIWLLKNKQTNRWESTKATAEAIYALLLTGDNWLESTKNVQVTLGGQKINPKEYEPGSGYFKQTWSGSEMKPSWSEVSVKNPNNTIVWGAAYRQYFDDLDNITTFKKTGLTIVRTIFRERNSAKGPMLEAIKEGDQIQVGDQVKVRIEIRSDRQMEFVHLKDMRPSGCEPKNVLSGYRYQGGLGYYESTRDLATHFFIDYLPRGTFVLEYPLVATHKGNMSFGISTLQSMYAPEFTSHSNGIRIKIE